MTEPSVFRSWRGGGVFFLLAGLPHATLGFVLIVVGIVYNLGDFCGYVLYGLCFLAGGVSMRFGAGLLVFRIIVDDHGLRISYRPLWPPGYGFTWEKVEWWAVELRRFQDEEGRELRPARAAVFHVRGRRGPIAVYEQEVYFPGFEAFLTAVRRYITEKERPERPPVDDDGVH